MTRLSPARPWLTAALTLTALVGWAVPATAAALVYETRQVTAIAPDADPGTDARPVDRRRLGR